MIFKRSGKFRDTGMIFKRSGIVQLSLVVLVVGCLIVDFFIGDRISANFNISTSPRFGNKNMSCASECAKFGKCFKSGWDNAAVLSRYYTRGCTSVIYTVSLSTQTEYLNPFNGNWEGIYEYNFNKVSQKCSIAFVHSHSPYANNHRIVHDNWTLVRVDGASLAEFPNLRKASKVPKLSPAHFFHSSVHRALYIDDKLQLISTMKHIISFMNTSVAMLLTPHPINKNVQAEVQLIALTMAIRPNVTFEFSRILDQADHYEKYRLINQIEYTPTFDSAFILHNLKSTAAQELRCTWYQEYVMWGDRDQVSGFHILSKLLHATRLLPTLYNSSRNSSAHLEFIPVLVRDKQVTNVRILPAEYHHEYYLTMADAESRAACKNKRFVESNVPPWH